jgi:hypothetical protein
LAIEENTKDLKDTEGILTMESKPSPRQFHTLEQWKEMIEDWKKSGLTVHAYCKEKGMTYSVFMRWQKKIINPVSPNSSSCIPRKPAHDFSPAQKKEFVKDWKKSGLTQKVFVVQKGLNPSTFKKWSSKFKSSVPFSSPSPSPQEKFSFEEQFTPVTIKPSSLTNPSSSSPRIEVTLSQGHQLSIQGPFHWEGLIPLLTSILRS